jgi:hypothetical protein
MLHDPQRHEALQAQPWDEALARQCLQRIVTDAEQSHIAGHGWRVHPLDDPKDPLELSPSLYYGACGVWWALRYLQGVGAVQLQQADRFDAEGLIEQTQRWLGEDFKAEQAAYLMGETPIRMVQLMQGPDAAAQERLAALIEGNLDHPARELMWGSPGTLLAALFLHQRTGQARFAELFRASARRLWSQLQWSEARQCHYWVQDLYGRQSSYLDAVHGFVATALPLIRGRHLLEGDEWAGWQQTIANTMQRTATWEDGRANWLPMLDWPADRPARWLMQYCHGAPGFVICLADFPGTELDDLLRAAGEATWFAGPLNKGANLCHGTGGNGYAFLKLYERTGDALWLQRARAFAMHGITQFEAHATRYGMLRHSLWTGDPGFAIYLWDCIRGRAEFPTLDRFYPA